MRQSLTYNSLLLARPMEPSASRVAANATDAGNPSVTAARTSACQPASVVFVERRSEMWLTAAGAGLLLCHCAAVGFTDAGC